MANKNCDITDEVSLIQLRNLVLRILPRTNLLRFLILSEHDYPPRVEARAKVEVFARLLYEEILGKGVEVG